MQGRISCNINDSKYSFDLKMPHSNLCACAKNTGGKVADSRLSQSVPVTILAIGCSIAASIAPQPACAETVVVVFSMKSNITITKTQAIDIFLGKTSRFPNGEPAAPIDQAQGSTARDNFYPSFRGKSPAQLKAHWSKSMLTGRARLPGQRATSNDAKIRLAREPRAIVYLDHGKVASSMQIVTRFRMATAPP